MQAPEIIDAAPQQQETLAGVLAEAFRDDPAMNWMIPAPNLYASFFRLLARDLFLPQGIAQLDKDEQAAALWLPPGVKFEVRPGLSLYGLMLKLLLRKGPRPLLRFPQQELLFHRHVPAEPHYHLVFLGCRESARGQGRGSALLNEVTRVCEEQRLPAYLESSNQLNIPLYQRHGFDIIAEESLPGGGPRVWFMWREAR